MRTRWIIAFFLAAMPAWITAQTIQTPAQMVQSIARPRNPLPDEEASAGVMKFSFIVYGDTRGRRDGTEIQHEHSLVVDGVLAAIKRLETSDFPVRFVLQTGDAVVNGREARQWNTSFVSLINRITTEGGVPYFLAPGNHDVTAAEALDSPQRLLGLTNYLQAMKDLIPPDNASRRLTGYPAYAFGYGNTLVVALDSNIAGDTTQYEWVKSQLEGLDRRRYVNVIAFFHHPVFTSGPHGGARIERPTAALRSLYMPLFRAHHVIAVFVGHDHLFEHWIERYTDNEGVHRMDHITTGGGGAPLYAYRGEPDFTEYLAANEAAKVQVQHLVKPGLEPGENPYHFVIVRVDGGRLDLEVAGIDFGRNWQPYRSNKTTLRDGPPGGP
ncbi:MAG: metallophosphoesterase [Acidobacteria bacterium]|nr:metallophosphoesterase [Acidobacteriota bacterium]